jgi:predicted permease
MRDFVASLSYALRQFRNAPIFTAAAILTLSLGIGGTTAIFSLMHTVMLRSLPVADPGTLYRIGEGDDCCVEGGPQDRWGLYSYPLYLRLQQNLPEFQSLTAFQAGPDRMSVRRESEQVAKPLRAEYVTGSYFSTFGIRPYGGRLFNERDDQVSAAPVAVISHRAWQTNYGSDPAVVGSTFLLEGHAFTIVGIAPPGFYGETLRSDPPELWLPLQQEMFVRGNGSLLQQPITAWLRVIGRLKPGARVDGLSPRLTGLLRNWLMNDSGYPAEWLPEIKRLLPKQVINVIPAGTGVAIMKEEYGRSLQILLAVCGLVLLIACANVANLMLARAAARRAQTAMRLALGATRRQVVSQALVESVLLAVLGGIAGLAVAVAASRLLLSLAFHSARNLPFDTTPSLPVLGFAFAVSLLTGIVFGTAPAWFATRTDPIEALRGSGRATRDSSALARNALLIAQAVLSVVLLAGATMLARSLGNLERQDFGFETHKRVMVGVNPPSPSYTAEKLNAMYRAIEDRLRALPGVEQAGLALYTPLTDNWGELVVVEGRPPAQLKEESAASWDRVSAHYFATTGQKILRGRGFTEADNENTAPVAVVNETFVRRFFPNEDPLEKRFGLDLPENAGTFRIVGVVRDAKYTQPRRAPRPMFFVSLTQHVKYAHPLMQKIEQQSHLIGGIMLLTGTPAGVLEPAVTKLLASYDPNLTVTDIRPLAEQVNLVFDQERAVASLAGVFAVMALLLAAIGLYGVLAYIVAQRTNDIGVRIALGADRAGVIRMVLAMAFKRIGIGLVLGVPLAIGAGHLLAAQLWGVQPWDPLALSLAIVSLGISAFVAAVIPALRAASISPMDALRAE